MPHARSLSLAFVTALLLAPRSSRAASAPPSADPTGERAPPRERAPSDRGRVTVDRVVGFGSPSHRYQSTYLGFSALGALGGGGALLSPVTASTVRFGGQTSRSLALRPSLDVGLGKHFTAGAELGLTFDRSHMEGLGAPEQSATTRSTSWHVEPRVGYWIALAPHIGVWPRIGAGVGRSVARTTSTGDALGPIRSTSDALSARTDVRLVALIADHVLVSFGPEASFSYFNRVSTRASLGGSASLGVLF